MELKKKKTRIDHICSKCGNKISRGDYYFCEERFLASLKKNQIKL